VARSVYRIAFARRGAAHLWHEMFDDPANPSKEALKAHKKESLGFTETFEAWSFEEAIRLARTKHPEFIVIKSGSGRVGSA
jgi:hypothetical protein